MKWKHKQYTPGDWEGWISWHPVILADTGQISWLDLIWRKQIPYPFKYRKHQYGDTTEQKQWWIYADDNTRIRFWSDWEYEVI